MQGSYGSHRDTLRFFYIDPPHHSSFVVILIRMSQMQWTYLDDRGGRYNVGLYHGSATGHLMIHCNGRIVVIDFNVFTNKKYSFLINDELCDLHVENNDGAFAYGLEINKDANTPANMRRKKRDRSDWIQSLLCAALLFSAIGLCVFFVLGKGYF